MFRFRQFTIHQDRCAMKVGTDGVLLGAWASLLTTEAGHHLRPTSVTNDARILDIGTGTGLLSLMMAQRMSEANPTQPFSITAIEIDEAAAQQAQENFSDSPWGPHFTLVNQPLQTYQTTDEYQLILSNPPFYNATLKPDDEARAMARHKDSLPVAEIMHFAQSHLSEGGRLALIYPTDYDSEVMTAAVLSGLQAVRLCDVLTKVGKPCKRRMAEFMRSASPHPQLCREELAIRDAEGKFSPSYRQLTEPFYLHLSD